MHPSELPDICPRRPDREESSEAAAVWGSRVGNFGGKSSARRRHARCLTRFPRCARSQPWQLQEQPRTQVHPLSPTLTHLLSSRVLHTLSLSHLALATFSVRDPPQLRSSSLRISSSHLTMVAASTSAAQPKANTDTGYEYVPTAQPTPDTEYEYVLLLFFSSASI